MLLKPFTYRFVVNLHYAQGKDDAYEYHAGIYGDMYPQRSIGMLCHPAHLHIHNRLVGNVERIRKFSEPFADGGAPLVGGNASASGQHYERENEQDTDCLIKAVRNSGLTAYARDGENDNEHKAAPPETALQMNRTAARIALAAA